MSEAHAAHPHHHELKNPDGSWKYTNALSRESSPYLLQHAHNPVEWHPWGEEAFTLARTAGKPIFLSIGYSTCYWCHVMERQVFENPTIAQQMNQSFVNIKMDREERPDVDDIYMNAVHVMGQQGGWPMSVFLTPPGAKGAEDPGLRPFYAGTYFPPAPAFGRPSFPQVLEALSHAWQTQRQELLETADQVAEAVQAALSQTDEPGELSVELVEQAAGRIFRSYDREHGGFGGAPKFPVPTNLLLLMAIHQGNPQPDLGQAIAHTLDRMARGGMYDQIAGGFHRYSTDARWLVPHFEKMLYDNAQLVEAYVTAQAIQPDPDDPGLYLRVVRQTCDYVLREMTDPTGTFWSAQDAEVDGAEGGSYLWTEEEVRQALLDAALAELALALYGLDQGPNFTDPHLPGAQPVNVLYQPRPLPQLAQERGLAMDDLLARKAEIDGRLLAVRSRRKQPATDDKVLTAWNGMMIAGMALAGQALGEQRYLDAASRAADYILAHLRTDDGGLLRTMRRGQAKIPAFLEDYAYFAHGLLALHRATGLPRWLEEAASVVRAAQQRFADGQGAYYDTLADQADLFVRTRGSYDGAVPSGNSQMAHNLLDLYELTGRREYFEQATAALQCFAERLRTMGHGMANMSHALLRAMQLAPAPGSALAPGSPAPGKASRKRSVVEVEVSPRELDLAAGSAAVTVTLTIGPDYHLNAANPGIGGVIPTHLELRHGEGLALEVEYPPGTPKRYPFADQPIAVYEGQVRLQATVRRNQGGAVGSQARLVLRYQVCTALSCLEPREVELPVRFKLEGKS